MADQLWSFPLLSSKKIIVHLAELNLHISEEVRSNENFVARAHVPRAVHHVAKLLLALHFKLKALPIRLHR